MKKILILIQLFMLFAASSLVAQNISSGSIIKAAKADGKRLRLDSIGWQRFKADKQNYSSDLFKPVPALVSDTILLRDSAYVKAFRRAAYEKASHSRTAGHYILIGGVITSGVVVIILVIRSLGNNLSNNIINGLNNARL
jgi:hypothetical protein